MSLFKFWTLKTSFKNSLCKCCLLTILTQICYAEIKWNISYTLYLFTGVIFSHFLSNELKVKELKEHNIAGKFHKQDSNSAWSGLKACAFLSEWYILKLARDFSWINIKLFSSFTHVDRSKEWNCNKVIVEICSFILLLSTIRTSDSVFFLKPNLLSYTEKASIYIWKFTKFLFC